MTLSTWTVVVPVKRLVTAKSRLRGALPGVPHEELALALAVDTVRAVLASPVVAEVLVVTDDAQVGDELGALGARIMPDPPGAAGLNAAFRHGMAAATMPSRAGLTADLPALRVDELTAALVAAASPEPVRRFVADTPGTGTVLLAAPPGMPLEPRFGPDSASAHRASGALPLTGAWPTLRRDVDTPADLLVARRLGLGRRTAALTAARRSPGPGARTVKAV